MLLGVFWGILVFLLALSEAFIVSTTTLRCWVIRAARVKQSPRLDFSWTGRLFDLNSKLGLLHPFFDDAFAAEYIQWRTQHSVAPRVLFSYVLTEQPSSNIIIITKKWRRMKQDGLLFLVPTGLADFLRTAKRKVMIPERVQTLHPYVNRNVAIALYENNDLSLLNIPNSLQNILNRLHEEGYNVGSWTKDASGERLVAALTTLGPMASTVVNDEKFGSDGAVVNEVSIDRKKDWTEGLSARDVGLQLGNIFIFVQSMRRGTQYDVATSKMLQQPKEKGGVGCDVIIHLGMHGAMEWSPGNDGTIWKDELLGHLPNIYVHPANNPSESLLAKQRGYGTLISYNVPPCRRAGLYLELANLKELLDGYRAITAPDKVDMDLLRTIFGLAHRSGMLSDVPFPETCNTKSDGEGQDSLQDAVPGTVANEWVTELYNYLISLQGRLFSSGLHSFGAAPTDNELDSYLAAYFGDELSGDMRYSVIREFRSSSTNNKSEKKTFPDSVMDFISKVFYPDYHLNETAILEEDDFVLAEAKELVRLLSRSTDELDNLMKGLDGGYIAPGPSGDFLRDGVSVLPTGRNTDAADPSRMPSRSAWTRGQHAAETILQQHKDSNNGTFPETVAVTLWGLDSMKTGEESLAIVLALIGAEPVHEETGSIVRFDLLPLEKLKRPRIDVLASLSGIFRDSFANVVDLLDDMFERAAQADEPIHMNYIKKHARELVDAGVIERPAARLFSNPPGNHCSLVNEVVDRGDWDESASLGEIWKERNAFSYGRKEGSKEGIARPKVLDKLLTTTERVVQEIACVEYGLSDIPDYYAHTGALKQAAEHKKQIDPNTGQKRKVALSVVESFGELDVKDVEEILRIEYRSKLLNPKWRDAMLAEGSSGANAISQRMNVLLGWAAITAHVDNFVFDQAAERYIFDKDVTAQLQKANPEAFQNVVKRLIEASNRGMWSTDETTLHELHELYVDDVAEQRIINRTEGLHL